MTTTTHRGYHCSPNAALTFAADLCVADDQNVAALYRRGGDAPHHLYTLAWDAADVTACDEATLIATWERITGREHDESQVATWDVAKSPKVRRALAAEGYTAIVYGDSHEGCDYETTDFLRLPESLEVVAREVIE